MTNIIVKGWDEDPKKRPTLSYIIENLEKLIEKETAK